MEAEKFFWHFFKYTGNIGAYLLYKELSRKNNYLAGNLNVVNRKGRKLG